MFLLNGLSRRVSACRARRGRRDLARGDRAIRARSRRAAADARADRARDARDRRAVARRGRHRARSHAAGLDDAELLHAIALSAYFGHLNRIADAVAVPLDYDVRTSRRIADPRRPVPAAPAPLVAGEPVLPSSSDAARDRYRVRGWCDLRLRSRCAAYRAASVRRSWVRRRWLGAALRRRCARR